MTEQSSVQRFIGIYDANGTVFGELSYLVRRTVAGEHCSLCDITHGRLRERSEWRDARARLPVPFVTYHRNDQPAAVLAATGGPAPRVRPRHQGRAIQLGLAPRDLAAPARA